MSAIDPVASLAFLPAAISAPHVGHSQNSQSKYISLAIHSTMVPQRFACGNSKVLQYTATFEWSVTLSHRDFRCVSTVKPIAGQCTPYAYDKQPTKRLQYWLLVVRYVQTHTKAARAHTSKVVTVSNRCSGVGVRMYNIPPAG